MNTTKQTPPNIHRLQVKALGLAIESLRRERRRNFAGGEDAFRRGFRTQVIPKNDEGVTGHLFAFAEDDHLSYLEYTQAIEQLGDLIDILNDPGVSHE